jgi:hypothetical protein
LFLWSSAQILQQAAGELRAAKNGAVPAE